MSFQSEGAGSFGRGECGQVSCAELHHKRRPHVQWERLRCSAPLSARAGVRARLGRTARSRNEARQQQREQSKADRELAKAEEQERLLNLPARSVEVDFGNDEVSAFSFSNRLYDSKRGQRYEHPGCKTPAVKVLGDTRAMQHVLKRIHVKLRPFCPLSDQDPPVDPPTPLYPRWGGCFWVPCWISTRVWVGLAFCVLLMADPNFR